MSTLEDIAYILANCDNTTLIVLHGPAASGKSFLTQAITSYFKEAPEIHIEDESDWVPSPTYTGPCRIYQSLSSVPIIDATYPWIRWICCMKTDKQVIGQFDSQKDLALKLEEIICENEW